MPFDPEAPLPGAPDPWSGSSMPERRATPPYLMTEMITAVPALAERLARRLPSQQAVSAVASAIREAVAAGRTVVTTGCGTSEHAAMAIAAFLDSALRAGAGDGGDREPWVASVQAFELSRQPPQGGVVVAVSHEGGTWATNEALRAARAAGCTTALITVSDRSPGAALSDIVITTDEQDQSWCHTVGYLSPLLAGAALTGTLAEQPLDPIGTRALLQAADDEPSAESIAASLGGCSRLLLVGSGIDYVTARELALKIEEGARLPANAHQLETIRHGHLAAADERTGLVLVLTDAEARGAVLVERASAVLRSAAALGMPAAAILAADLGDDVQRDLTSAGRVAAPLTSHLPRLVAAALAAAIAGQLIAERLARARNVNPDTLGREGPRQAAAADA